MKVFFQHVDRARELSRQKLKSGSKNANALFFLLMFIAATKKKNWLESGLILMILFSNSSSRFVTMSCSCGSFRNAFYIFLSMSTRTQMTHRILSSHLLPNFSRRRIFLSSATKNRRSIVFRVPLSRIFSYFENVGQR